MGYFLAALKASGRLDQVGVTVCLVGSRRGDEHDPFDATAEGWECFVPQLNIYGFEPDEEACVELNTAARTKGPGWKEQHFPQALWDCNGKKTLYVTKSAGASSMFRPSPNFVDRYWAGDTFDVVKTAEVEVTTLDEFWAARCEPIDYLQIDVQGGELAVLRGAQATLCGVLFVIVEVAFLEMYEGQALQGEVDVFLREQGFTLASLQNLSAYSRRTVPLRGEKRFGIPGWANAFYVRDLLQVGTNDRLRTPANIFKLFCLVDALGFVDYAMEILVYLTVNHGNDPQYNFADLVVQVLAQHPEASKQGIWSIPVVQKVLPWLRNPAVK